MDRNVRLGSLSDVAMARSPKTSKKKTYGGNQSLVLNEFGELSDGTARTTLRTRKKRFALHRLRIGKRTTVKFARDCFPAKVNCFDTYSLITLQRNISNAPSASTLALRRAI